MTNADISLVLTCDVTYLKNNHEIIYLSHSKPIHLSKNI